MSSFNFVGLHNSHQTLMGPASFIAWNWFYAYGVLSSRTIKQIYGIDNQANPRQDLNKYGADAVRTGKITQSQLERIQRFESASANSTEGFTMFAASVLFALISGVPKNNIDLACSVYTVGRLVYGALYVLVANNRWAQARGITWWTCNLSCLSLLWIGGRRSVVIR